MAETYLEDIVVKESLSKSGNYFAGEFNRQKVAIKKLQRDDCQVFERDWNLVKNFSHNNVVQYIEYRILDQFQRLDI